ncbi:hypothetical protein HGRIS_011502 [Hohenbuehelia grisea]|uniref:Alpha-galactosidase n=1 Tax=Hohenbuehelia grisea TaxID=104357 RepID=A0ABR3JVB0_9AGAR
MTSASPQLFRMLLGPPFPQLIVLAILLGLIAFSDALNNGVGRTPAMGWNPYNAYLCTTTEAQYRAAAQSLIDLGLKGLGYQYVNLDCGWQGKTRASNGTFTWDAAQIPSGVPALASYVHSLGFKFGMYSDGGVFACDFVGGTAHYLGSLGHEADDAKTFASWGADYLKVQFCPTFYVPGL